MPLPQGNPPSPGSLTIDALDDTLKPRIKIGEYIAASDEAEKTISFDAVDFTKDSKIVVDVMGKTTLAFTMQMRLNGVTAGDYNSDLARFTGGLTTAPDNFDNISTMVVFPSQINDAGGFFLGTIDVAIPEGAGADNPIIKSDFAGTDGRSIGSGRLKQDHDSITSITLRTSTSTWKIGTKITVYRVPL